MSTTNPSRFEYQLCQECHGEKGLTTRSLLDKSRLFNPNNASYHPVEAPAKSDSPSIVEELAGVEISCTDCHGNSDPDGPAGPHGSGEAFLLKFNYTTVDGNEESEEAYSLCYTCHEREKVLASTLFPEHQQHIVDEATSCATCHNPHGSIDNRALIRFGEETTLGGVSPSGLTGQLAYESMGLGSGACYLTCHGYDHSPETYGGALVPLDDPYNRSPARTGGRNSRPRPKSRGDSR
jgi:predicted CXXCH cytochrome family protein